MSYLRQPFNVCNINEMNSSFIFNRIYENRIWGDGSERNPLSGSGSNPSNASPFVLFVKKVIALLEISKVLDVGHGDWAMWRDYKFEDVSYIGVDVTQGLSESLNLQYGNKNRQFIHLADGEYHLPAADLVISKDVLQHLATPEIQVLLRSFSNMTYLILCNNFCRELPLLLRIRRSLDLRSRLERLLAAKSPFYSVSLPKNNSNIVTGDCRGLDLLESPFAECLEGFRLIEKFDYDGPKRAYFTKRVYLFENAEIKD